MHGHSISDVFTIRCTNCIAPKLDIVSRNVSSHIILSSGGNYNKSDAFDDQNKALDQSPANDVVAQEGIVAVLLAVFNSIVLLVSRQVASVCRVNVHTQFILYGALWRTWKSYLVIK